MAVGTDNLTRLLWNSGSGVFSLWRVNADASVTAFPFGPYAGWTANQVAIGTDNVPRLLWNYSDGTCAIDTVNESTGGFTSLTFGPYPGWSATALAMSNATPRLLWNKTDGTASLYSVSPSGGYTYAQFGPYAGYTAKFLAAGPNAAPCLLWTNTNGQVALWTNADASYPAGSALVYSAPTGCVPLALTVDASNAPRILWNNASAQSVTLWTVATNGTYTSQSYNYPSGCTPVGLGAATDGSVRVLWNNPGGVGSVPPGSVQVGIILNDGMLGPTLNLGPVATNDPPQIGGSWVLDHYLCSGSTVYGTSPFPWPAIVKVTNGKGVSYSDTSASPVTNTALSFLTSASDGNSTSVSGTITPVFVWSGPGNAPAGQVNVLVMPDAYGTGSASNATDGFASDITTFQTYAYASSGTHLETVPVTASQASFAVTGLPMMTGKDPRGIFQAGVSMNASLFTASLGGHSTVDTSTTTPLNPWDPSHPRFFSGTNCSAVANAVAISNYVKQAQLLITDTNGVDLVVKQYYDTSAAPNPLPANAVTGTSQPSAPLSVVFDSTHFADGTPITIKMTVLDTAGNSYDSKISASAYNKAYVLGNHTLTYGAAEAQDTSTIFNQMKAASGQSGYSTNKQPDTMDLKPTILQNLPTYSAMVIDTHANKGLFGDCSYYDHEPYTPSGLLFAANDPTSSLTIPKELGTKAVTIPPYNFVFIDGCDTTDDNTLAVAFGVNTIPDTGFIGWTGQVMDEPAHESCNQQLMQDLSDGMTLYDARGYAIAQFPVDAIQTNDQGAKLDIFGDKYMRLHNTAYDGTTSIWFK